MPIKEEGGATALSPDDPSRLLDLPPRRARYEDAINGGWTPAERAYLTGSRRFLRDVLPSATNRSIQRSVLGPLPTVVADEEGGGQGGDGGSEREGGRGGRKTGIGFPTQPLPPSFGTFPS